MTRLRAGTHSLRSHPLLLIRDQTIIRDCPTTDTLARCLLEVESVNCHHPLQSLLPNAPTLACTSLLCPIPSLLFLKSFCRPSKHCTDCGKSYTSERSHRAVCTRQEVSCVYPDPNSDGRGERVILHRVDGYFKCVRCGKALKKDQNMKVCHVKSSMM